MDKVVTDLSFYKGKRVLVTGHSGFKGSWLCKLLVLQGAQVFGFSLGYPTEPSLFRLADLEQQMDTCWGDIGDSGNLANYVDKINPEIVLHLAAQPIVRDSYKNPVYTYRTNIMGTVHMLDAVRNNTNIKSLVNVTTDKVYHNREWEWGYRETDELNGYDPYSNSKSCSELITSSYVNSFFHEHGPAMSTARAGNVLGGGDFANDRIIPDCVRAARMGENILVRNPYSIRPYQHVLEPVTAYLIIAMRQMEDPSYAGSYNIGPDDTDCVTNGTLVDLFCKLWGEGITWESGFSSGPHEAGFLKLDCSKFKTRYGWSPRWNIEDALQKTVEWTKSYFSGESVSACMEQQITKYLKQEN